MKTAIFNLPTSKAALTVGIAFLTSAVLVSIVDDLLLSNFVIPGDTDMLAKDIAADRSMFGLAAIGYLLVLTLDIIVGLALYVVLRPANKNLASLTSGLRLLYAFTLVIAVLVLALQLIDVYSYASVKLIGYVFFGLHILVLGYAVFKSGYMPKSLGVLLILASFSYLVFFVDFYLSPPLMTAIMLLMAIAELSLSIWLIVKRNALPEN